MSKNGDLINAHFAAIMGDPVERELAERDGDHTEAVPVRQGQLRFAKGRTLDAREFDFQLLGASTYLDEELLPGQCRWLSPTTPDYRQLAPKSLKKAAKRLREQNSYRFGFGR